VDLLWASGDLVWKENLPGTQTALRRVPDRVDLRRKRQDGLSRRVEEPRQGRNNVAQGDRSCEKIDACHHERSEGS